MSLLRLDHIAVAGLTLAEAQAHCEHALGVALQPGGQHPDFGTHNALLGLADGLYLEAIAIDPAAPPPARPRWFDLDRFDGPARLTNWICATDDMAAALTALPEGAGVPIPLRRGDLRWRMAVPDSGILPFANMHPAIIQWDSARHPATRLAPSGCTLRRLTVTHPDAAGLRAALSGLLDDPRIAIEEGAAPGLSAEFDTPHGTRVLT